eukprot:8473859-Alexandrium_andersonii.AAC.1
MTKLWRALPANVKRRRACARTSGRGVPKREPPGISELYHSNSSASLRLHSVRVTRFPPHIL